MKKRINNKKEIAVFVKFLKDNDAYTSFVAEYYKYLGKYSSMRTVTQYLSYSTIFKSEAGINVIACAFYWDETYLRSRYWLKLNTKWFKITEKLYENGRVS